MRELTDAEKQQLEQHQLWLESNGASGAKLNWCNAFLCYVNLSRADLREADLCGATLYVVNLYKANLRGANLREANLYDTHLCYTDLQGADLCCAYMQGADLSGAKGYIDFGNVGSNGHTLHCVIHADGWHCYTGCFGGTLDEFEKAVESVHGNDRYGEQYRGIIEYLREIEHLYKEDFASE